MKPPEPLGFHNAVSPLALRHKIPFAGPIEVASPGNLPARGGRRPDPRSVKPPEPLGFHNSVSPPALRHKIPASLAPLKSPVPAICQPPPTTPRSSPVKLSEPETEFQSSVSPLAFCQRMSALLSLLKKFGGVVRSKRR